MAGPISSAEPLSSRLPLYTVKPLQPAVRRWFRITDRCSRHPCKRRPRPPGRGCRALAALHSNDEGHIRRMGLELPVSRLVVNQASALTAGGSLTNGFAPTTTLGCGSWGGNSISENLVSSRDRVGCEARSGSLSGRRPQASLNAGSQRGVSKSLNPTLYQTLKLHSPACLPASHE